MDADRKLPKFRTPPLTEVVHGVQFQRLPMTIVHPGLFYATLKGGFPRSQTVPPLPPIRPTYELSPVIGGIQFAEPDEVPRAWFIGQDGSTLIQLQSDRLLFNWRRDPGNAEYPHFEEVHASFRTVYGQLERFISEEVIGDLRPQICEMTYINQFPTEGRSLAQQAGEIFRG